MSLTHKVKRSFTSGSEVLEYSETINTGSAFELDVAIVASSTDIPLACAIDVSEMKTLFLLATQDMTLETNDGTTPAATVTLKAGIPVVWTSTSGQTNPFGSTNVTGLYVTSTLAGTFKMRTGIDPRAGALPD